MIIFGRYLHNTGMISWMMSKGEFFEFYLNSGMITAKATAIEGLIGLGVEVIDIEIDL